MFRLELFTTKYGRAKRRIATIVLCLGIATSASAQEWRLVELPATPLGWKNVTPRAINAAGQIVGEHLTEAYPIDFSPEAFFFDGRSWIGLGTLGGDTSWAEGLNDRGEVVGRSDTAWTTDCYTWSGGTYCSPEVHAFVWRDGGLHDLGAQGAWSMAAGINDVGSIAGTAESFAQQWAPDGTVERLRNLRRHLPLQRCLGDQRTGPRRGVRDHGQRLTRVPLGPTLGATRPRDAGRADELGHRDQ